jgi:diguanylate cyclase (GGDEF)-like protein
MLVLRTLAVAVACWVIVDVDPAPATPWLVAAVLVGHAAFAGYVWRRRGGTEVVPLTAWPDAIAMSLGVLLVPELALFAAVFLGAFLHYVAAAFGRRHVLVMAAVCAVPVTVGLAGHQPEQWVGALGVFVVLAANAVFVAGDAMARAVELRRAIDQLLDALDVVVWEVDGADGSHCTVLGPVERQIGHSAAQLSRPGSWEQHVYVDDRHVVTDSQREVAAGRDHVLRYRTVLPDGRPSWREEIVKVMTDGTGRLRRLRGLIRDIDDEMAAQVRAEQFAEFVQQVPFGVLLVRFDDPDDPESLVITAANPSMRRYLTIEPAQAVGLRLADVVAGLGGPHGRELFNRLSAAGRAAEPVRLEVETELWPGLGTQHLAVVAVPLHGGALAVVVDDLTARVRAERALAERASIDPLTGLINRRELMERLRSRLDAPDARAVTLLIADLDRFKDVNDAFGHERGDRFLQKVAERLQLAAPSGAVVARLGGDEFALLLAPGATAADGIAAAASIEEALLEPVAVTPWLQLHVGTSIGIASAPEHAGEADDLLVRADVAMYAAKRAGGGHQVYDSSLDRSSVRRMVLLGDLRRAIASGELVLHYQPVVDAEGTVVSVEGLVRWTHPDLGIVLPEEFIELVELGSLSQPLAFAVVRQAVQYALTCRAMGRPIGVSVNLTPRNLTDPGLLDGLERVVREADLPAGSLTVELTERHLLADSTETHDALARLRRAGLRVSIDDFGTGSTSLYVLRSLQIDELKIDRVFVEDLRNGHDTVVRSIVDLAHDLGLGVVAEGVEDDDTRHRLVALGVDRLQGFAIGRPVSADVCTRLVAERGRVA